MKKIGICCDHAGFELKEYVRGWLEAKGWEYKDFGTYSTDSCDYPDFAHPLALAVEASECYPGIAICGSGNGISMTLSGYSCRTLLDSRNRTHGTPAQRCQRIGYARPLYQHGRGGYDYDGIFLDRV